MLLQQEALCKTLLLCATLHTAVSVKQKNIQKGISPTLRVQLTVCWCYVLPVDAQKG